MLDDPAKVLVVGGGSRIAAALAPLLKDDVAFVSRTPAGRLRDTIVDDYGTIPLSTFTGAKCVVNCVGVSSGDVAVLREVNVDIAQAIGGAAKTASVPHLIQVSSFSVYGGAERIDADVHPSPASDYGRSKLAADATLLALADYDFAVTVLRLPLIYGQDVAGKLGQLLRLWLRARALPVPADDVSRAMIGLELVAETIARLTTKPRTGIVFAADPRPFTYTDAANARWEQLYHLSIPRGMTQFIARAFPSIGGRLFADSRLADSDNLAIAYGLQSRLYRDIAAADLG